MFTTLFFRELKPEVIFENDNIIAFNKPSGLLSIPDRFDKEKPYVKMLVGNKYGDLYTVHRLDRETSGVICFARNEPTHRYLSQLFEKRKVEKYYTAIVHGRPLDASGNIIKPIVEQPAQRGKMMTTGTGKEAHTAYEIVQSWNSYSLLRLQIFTGRTHQIRVHMQYIGNPVVCDEVYGSERAIYLSAIKKNYKLSKNELEERPVMGRLCLHAAQLILQDEQGNAINIEAPLPKDMKAFISQLNKNL
jgi:23S rRNA pseudouridine955/2504/2580 synthase/23S rRNA pseudouridine1911/1915/1917 synthase